LSTGSGRAAGSILTNRGCRASLPAAAENRLKSQKGAVLLEFAFAVTMLLFIFMGFVTVSLLFFDYYGVQKAAREGAREACISGSEEVARAKALESAWLWGLDPARVTVEFQADSPAQRVVKTCIVRYTARPFFKTFPTLLNRSPLQEIEITARAVFGWQEV
jgi:Flp pilus assembly protein TadG